MSFMDKFFKDAPAENDQPLEGRSDEIPTATEHFVNGAPLKGPFAEHLEQAMFGMGCFWGAERKWWQQSGVWTTAVGYTAGKTPNATYKEVCSGKTGHSEVVLVVFDPTLISYQQLLHIFWESHDPTQGMRQGNDIGTQYRSGIYTFNDAQQSEAKASLHAYQQALRGGGVVDEITTEIQPVSEFYYAEEYHQQYLAKNPDGYCGLKGTGVECPL